MYNSVNFFLVCVDARHALNFVTTVASSGEESDFVFRVLFINSSVAIRHRRYLHNIRLTQFVTGRCCQHVPCLLTCQFFDHH